MCIDKAVETKADSQAPQLATDRGLMWDNGRKIRVKFIGGDPYVIEKVKKYASEWEKYANIDFIFVDTGDAEIRISFTPNGSWSYIGEDALDISQSQPTMNFGWFNSSTTEQEFRRTTLHEFGHALGAIHEHQSPDAKIPWNTDKVYAYYMFPPNNWSKEKVDINIFEKYSVSLTQFSAYDMHSIMHYPIPNDLTIGDYSVGFNTDLSNNDKEFMSQLYPFSNTSYAISSNNYNYLVHDFNGDKKEDLIHLVNNVYGHTWKSTGKAFEVGYVTPWRGYAIGSNDYQYMIGDYNGDGKKDLIHFVNNEYTHPWISNGDGTYTIKYFKPWDGYAVGSNRYNYKVGDFNGDGRSDLLHLVNNDYVHMWYGKKDGSFNVTHFKPWDGYAVGSNEYNYKVGDFNGDGKSDLIHFVNNENTHVWFGKNDGSFNVTHFKPWDGYAVGSNGYNYKVGDFNGDGRSDLLHLVNNDYVHMWYGKKDGSFNVTHFKPWDGYAIGSNGYNYKVGDFNGDGRSDLLHLVNNDYVHMWYANEKNAFDVGYFDPW